MPELSVLIEKGRCLPEPGPKEFKSIGEMVAEMDTAAAGAIGEAERAINARLAGITGLEVIGGGCSESFR